MQKVVLIKYGQLEFKDLEKELKELSAFLYLDKAQRNQLLTVMSSDD